MKVLAFFMAVFGFVFIANLAYAEDTTIEMLNKRDDGAKMVYSEDITRIDVGDTITWVPTSKGHNVEIVAAVAAYAIWIVVSKILDEAKPVKEEHKSYWRVGQWVTTGFLWFTWLSHDMANIAVFLPREIPWDLMILISIVFIAGLAFMFREGGGKIQKIVLEKHNTRYVRSATIIDGVYWLILFFFKELNDIPMSTTWVFVGLLCGRELAMATVFGKEKFKTVFPLITKDFIKMMIGLGASVGVVLAIHYVIVPNGL